MPLTFYYHTLLARNPEEIEAAHRYLACKHEGFWPDEAWRDREFRIRSLRYVFFAYVTNERFADAIRLIRAAREAGPEADDPIIAELLQRCEAFLADRLIAAPDVYVPYRHERANRTKGFVCTRIDGGYRLELRDEGGAKAFHFTAPPLQDWKVEGPVAQVTDNTVEALFFQGCSALEVTAVGTRRSPRRTFPLTPLGRRVTLLPS